MLHPRQVFSEFASINDRYNILKRCFDKFSSNIQQYSLEGMDIAHHNDLLEIKFSGYDFKCFFELIYCNGDKLGHMSFFHVNRTNGNLARVTCIDFDKDGYFKLEINGQGVLFNLYSLDDSVSTLFYLINSSIQTRSESILLDSHHSNLF